ncbi:MAG: UvrB/UvrC motif-containing protein [Actinomycetota bacterium]
MSAEEPRPERQQLPPVGARRARDLSRTRTARPRVRDTGRRHHIGEVPAVVTVIKADGTVTTTRTSTLQLRDNTPSQLQALARAIEADMQNAAAALDFEEAAHLRDELEAVRRELSSR